MKHTHRYEAGMRIIHHVTTKTITVSFRNRVIHLGPYPSREEAVAAGEAYCRDCGWDDGDAG
jgi:hypothetical protein